MAVCIISHRLNLVLRFIDTTTGKPVSASELMLYADGKLLPHSERERGTLIFTELERNDFVLTVKSRNYETYSSLVRFSELDIKLPELSIQLIPSQNNIYPVPCLELKGILPGISELSAVRFGDNYCLIREFDPRKKLITVFNPHHLELERTDYALVDPEKQSFEPFKIIKCIDEGSFKIDRVLESSFTSYFPISPVLYGMTAEDGTYVLRVRDDSSSSKWIIRYKTGQQSQFFLTDLRSEHEITPSPQSNTFSKE